MIELLIFGLVLFIYSRRLFSGVYNRIAAAFNTHPKRILAIKNMKNLNEEFLEKFQAQINFETERLNLLIEEVRLKAQAGQETVTIEKGLKTETISIKDFIKRIEEIKKDYESY